ncbi:MAG: DUF3450 domain-containing protein [Xanthomonadales bacterium]|nr:DUF3450 domain-containing protein [Xanthomonadales bacterium]
MSSAFIFAVTGLSTQAFAASINEVMQEGENRADAGATAQTQIDSVADQTEKIVNDYRTVTKVVDGLRVYNALLQTQLDNQQAEMQALTDSIANVALIERQIIPLMTRMVDALDEFVQLDTPFLLKERTGRVERLREVMERSDVSAAEKFRIVIEGYQIENDYGRTIEAYKGSTEINGNQLEVDFLRIGRVSLLYQTVGGEHTGAWDKTANAFVELPPATYQKQVLDGLKIARKQVAPDLLVVPVGAPTRAMQ